MSQTKDLAALNNNIKTLQEEVDAISQKLHQLDEQLTASEETKISKQKGIEEQRRDFYSKQHTTNDNTTSVIGNKDTKNKGKNNKKETAGGIGIKPTPEAKVKDSE